MNALDTLLTHTAGPRAGTPCVIQQNLNNLAEPYKTALQTLITTPYKDGGYTADEVGARLKAAGLPGSATTVTRHRNGTCSCGNLEGNSIDKP